MIEVWKEVKGYELQFEASNLGRVKSLKRNGMKDDVIIKGRLDRNGYLYHRMVYSVKGIKKSFSFAIHRMVALAWHDNPENKPTVNHNDGNKLNNKPDNLCWMTFEENNKHATENGLRRKLGFGNPINQCNKPIRQLDTQGNIIKVHISAVVAAKEINGNNKSINNALNRPNNVYKGYKWEYV